MDLGALRWQEEVLLKHQKHMDGLVAQLQLFAAKLGQWTASQPTSFPPAVPLEVLADSSSYSSVGGLADTTPCSSVGGPADTSLCFSVGGLADATTCSSVGGSTNSCSTFASTSLRETSLTYVTKHQLWVFSKLLELNILQRRIRLISGHMICLMRQTKQERSDQAVTDEPERPPPLFPTTSEPIQHWIHSATLCPQSTLTFDLLSLRCRQSHPPSKGKISAFPCYPPPSATTIC
ncbi:hypothetical protein D5F01_LYC05312 [Larimichthys crocea]|uniref:Uncharacterized protein n=1 Tax=Larimichthys crocea TaxID=215358 RepID=A0A6G0IYF3_LARCR|nr:hypothetical protein D5F01_LYC05312 [Larimichthys crocea]